MQTSDTPENNQSMDFDDGYTTQQTDQPDSQDSTSSDQNDKFISDNDNFHRLVRENSNITEIEKALSNELVNINYQNVQGDSSLHVAVRQKNPEIVDLLIARGADVTKMNKAEKTPLKMVEERLKKYPYNADLISINESLLRVQPGPSSRPYAANDRDEDAPGPKRPKMDAGFNDQVVKTTDPSGLRLNLHGPIYQSKLLALFVKRALDKKYKFELVSEWEAAEKFDDVVFQNQSKPGEDNWTWRFVQAKHKQNIGKNKITMNDLMSTSDKNDFSLQKYFISYCKIKSREQFKKGILEDFIIITNTEFDQKILRTISTQKQQLAHSPTGSNQVPIQPDQKHLIHFVEETNLERDPILHIGSKKPRKFKISERETATNDLLELIRWDLFNSVLKFKEMKHSKFCNEKLTALVNLPNVTKAREQLAIAKQISIEIDDECKRKMKRKKKLLEKANSLRECVGKFLNEKNHEKLFSESKQIIFMINVAGAELIQEEDYYEKIRIKSNGVAETAEEILNKFQSTLDLYSDSNSEKFRGLENDKKELSDVETKLRNIHKEIQDETDISRIKEKMKEENTLIGKDRMSIISKDLIKENDLVDLKKKLNKRIGDMITEISTILVALNDETFDSEFDNFLRQFYIITNYPNEEDLSDILETELGKEFNLLDADLVSSSFEREMINFLKEYRGRFYTEHDGLLFLSKLKQKVGSLMSIGLCRSYTERLENYNIRFQNNVSTRKFFTGLNEFLSSTDTQVLSLSDIPKFKKTSLTKLSAIQVYRHLADCDQFSANDSYIFIRLGMILHQRKTREFILNSFQCIGKPDENRKNNFNLCVIECTPKCRRFTDKDLDNEYEEKLCEEFSNIFLNKHNKYKKLILITPHVDTFAEKLCKKLEQNFEGQKIYSQSENEINFRDLADDSQDQMLAKKVNFQGNCEITFNQLIDDKNLANQIIDSENLLKLIVGEPIQIGDEKPFNSNGFVEDYYVDRKFNSQKSFDNNSNNFNEMSLVELERKVKLLANDSGMGKSTTLTKIARNIRQISQNTWIFRINFVDYVNFIDKIKYNEDKYMANCIRFLSNMLIRGKIDANIRLQRKLFETCLEKDEEPLKKPPIILLFDGFNEISPSFNDKVTSLIISLKETNVSQIWITTRQHEKEELKLALKSDIYYLQPLSKNDQKDLLNRFLHWHLSSMTVGKGEKIRKRKYVEIIKCLENLESTTKKLNETPLSGTITDILGRYPKKNSKKSDKFNELKAELKTLSFDEYIDRILFDWNKGVFTKDKDFHGTPLNLKMLIQLICAGDQLIENFEPFYLYNKFVNWRFDNFYYIKSKMMSKNEGVKDTRETGEEYLLNIHYAMAVKVLFPQNFVQIDFDDLKTLEKKLNEPNPESNEPKREEKKILRVGLLTKEQDRFVFIHQSFAEFLLSKYLMKNLKKNANVEKIFVEKVLFESTHSVIRQFFNDQLKESGIIIELRSVSKEFLHQHKKHILEILKEENNDKIMESLNKNGLTEEEDIQ